MENNRQFNFGQKFNDNGNIVELIGVVGCSSKEYKCLITNPNGSKSFVRLEESFLKTLPYLN